MMLRLLRERGVMSAEELSEALNVPVRKIKHMIWHFRHTHQVDVVYSLTDSGIEMLDARDDGSILAKGRRR